MGGGPPATSPRMAKGESMWPKARDGKTQLRLPNPPHSADLPTNPGPPAGGRASRSRTRSDPSRSSAAGHLARERRLAAALSLGCVHADSLAALSAAAGRLLDDGSDQRECDASKQAERQRIEQAGE